METLLIFMVPYLDSDYRHFNNFNALTIALQMTPTLLVLREIPLYVSHLAERMVYASAKI